MGRFVRRDGGRAAGRAGPRSIGRPRFFEHEGQAAWALRLKGYRLLARRYRAPVGEIELVARRGRLLLAVKVKARRDLETAANAIDLRKQRRIARATEHFLAANPQYSDHAIRFDAVLIAPGRLPRPIPDAWRIT